ncbi:hypothetical protein TNCV_2536421 [Trichonephila clavipes]|nr:hypothetical protein TNCV_2536421 [Trichonephila clavipes]
MASHNCLDNTLKSRTVRSGTGLELVTSPATIRYLDYLATAALVVYGRISIQTASSGLAEHGLFGRRLVWCVPLTTSSNRKHQILWSRNEQQWTSQDWGHVLFSNESEYQIK